MEIPLGPLPTAVKNVVETTRVEMPPSNPNRDFALTAGTGYHPPLETEFCLEAEAPTKSIHLETKKADLTGKTESLERGSLRDLGYDVGDGLTKMIMASDFEEENQDEGQNQKKKA